LAGLILAKPSRVALLFWMILAAGLPYKGVAVSKAQPAQVPYTVLRTESGFYQTGTLRFTNHYVAAVRGDGARMWRLHGYRAAAQDLLR
jgi:hypothetical protein